VVVDEPENSSVRGFEVGNFGAEGISRVLKEKDGVD
jgi:hypothetical protein